jgi:hypothetical protein
MRIRVSDLKRIIKEEVAAAMPGRRESKGGKRMSMKSIIGHAGGAELDAALALVLDGWSEQWPDADVDLVMDKLYDSIQDGFDAAMMDLESPGYSLYDKESRDPRFIPTEIYMELSSNGTVPVDPHEAFMMLSDSGNRRVTADDLATAVGVDEIEWNGTGLRLMPDGTVLELV